MRTELKKSLLYFAKETGNPEMCTGYDDDEFKINFPYLYSSWIALKDARRRFELEVRAAEENLERASLI